MFRKILLILTKVLGIGQPARMIGLATLEVAMPPRNIFSLPLVLLFAAAQDAAKKDLDMFQGDWSLISAQNDGKALPEEDAKKITLSIHGNTFVVRKDSQVISEGTFTLDPTKKPKEVDETITA